jgi:hypothetical protein
MTFCEFPLLRSLLGVKRTCLFALHMSACDPKRTSRNRILGPVFLVAGRSNGPFPRLVGVDTIYTLGTTFLGAHLG